MALIKLNGGEYVNPNTVNAVYLDYDKDTEVCVDGGHSITIKGDHRDAIAAQVNAALGAEVKAEDVPKPPIPDIPIELWMVWVHEFRQWGKTGGANSFIAYDNEREAKHVARTWGSPATAVRIR